MRFVSLLAAALLILTGCAARTAPQPTISSTEGSTLVQTGQVMDVRDVTTAGGQTSGLGSVIGGLLGGLAGSQLGSGHGSTVAAIGGGLAGGVAGHKIEQAGNTRKLSEVRVRLASGEERTYVVEPTEVFRIGDAVKVVSRNGNARVTH